MNEQSIIVDQEIKSVDQEAADFLNDPTLVDPDAEKEQTFLDDADAQRFMLGALLTSKDVLAYASGAVSPRAWTQNAHQIIAHILIEHYRQFGDLPRQSMVLSEVQRAIAEKQKPTQHQILTEWQMVSQYTAIASPSEIKWVKAKIGLFAKRYRIAKLMKVWHQEPDPDKGFATFFTDYTKLQNLESNAPLYSVADLRKVEHPKWQVKGQFTQESTVCIYGDPNSGKSFLALDWALCTAAGIDWHGHKVEQCPVLYIYSEGFSGLPKRVWAWQKEHGCSDAQLKQITFSGTSHNLAEQAHRLLQQAEVALGTMPRLIVVDTLARNYEGSESDDEAMRAFVAALDWLKKTAKASVVVIHHQGKTAGKGLRGHSSLSGAMETVIHVEGKDEQSAMEVSCEKQKDYDLFAKYRLAKKVIQVGTDGDGDPITSCVWLPEPEEATLDKSRDAVERITMLSCLNPGVRYSTNEAVKTIRNAWKDGLAPSVKKVKAQLAYMRDSNEIEWEDGERGSFQHWVC